MSDTETALGPVDYLIVEWPAGTQPNGEGLKELANLTDRGLIRVLDLVFVTKGEDGAVAGLALAPADAGRRSKDSTRRPRAGPRGGSRARSRNSR